MAVALACAVPSGDQQPDWLGRCLLRGATQRWELPAMFREVSGLARAGDGRVFLHNDEQGVLAAFDHASGRIVGTYRLGPETPRDDFEGIAIVGERLFLLSSRGRLYETPLPPAGPATLAGLAFRRFSTGLAKECEFEGLAGDADGDTLLLACKTPYRKSLEGQLTIFRWSLSRNALAEPDRIVVPLEALAKGRPGKGFAASSLDRDPRTGRLLAVAGPDRAIAEFDEHGQVSLVHGLPRGHRQAEGVVVTPDGTLLIADEGARGPGTLTVYVCGAR